MKHFLKVFSLLLILTGCGYHWDDPDQLSLTFQTVSIPYIAGDEEGKMTDALVKALGQSSHFSYSSEGELTLQASIASDNYSNIGWQYDREPVSGQRINRLVPNEGRREITLRFSLVSEKTGKVLYGPFTVTANTDFDFVDSDSLLDTSFLSQAGNQQSVLFFSLGQLDSKDGASESSSTPLFSKLAHQVVEGMENTLIK